MCGRYVSPEQSAIERAWHIDRRSSEPFVRRFNVQQVHERMPVVLADEGHATWLDSRIVEPDELAALVARQSRPDAFEHYAVSTLVNNNKMDEARLIEPIEGSSRNP
jgi:hypothetical protein